MARTYTDDEFEQLSEEDRTKIEKRENRSIRRHTRAIQMAVLDKVTKDKDSEEFPNLDGSNKQTYAIVALTDSLNRDVAESEKALATKEAGNDAGALVTAVYEGLIGRLGDPSVKFASGERGERTVGSNTRLRPDNAATDQHMRIGNDTIDFEDVFYKDKDKEKK